METQKKKRISKAKEGLALSPDEFMRRRAAGLNITNSHKPVYKKNATFDDVDVEKFAEMDPFEKRQAIQMRHKILSGKLQELHDELQDKNFVQEQKTIEVEKTPPVVEKTPPVVEK